MNSQKIEKLSFKSFRRKPESSNTKNFWTPAFAGVTAWRTFYEAVTSHDRNKTTTQNVSATSQTVWLNLPF
jgi:hypothetical protein